MALEIVAKPDVVAQAVTNALAVEDPTVLLEPEIALASPPKSPEHTSKATSLLDNYDIEDQFEAETDIQFMQRVQNSLGNFLFSVR